MRLFLIEDDLKLAQHLCDNLKDHGFHTTAFSSHQEVVEVLNSPLRPDFIVMDRLLGSADSKQLMPDIRKKWPQVPIIILSAISTPNERTDLLNLGADDYLGKPFSTQELIARIRALARRSSTPVNNYVQVGNLVIDSMKRIISVNDKAENLPTREFTLLHTLAIDPTRVWSKEELLDYVWGQSTNVDTNVVESTIANIRKKLKDLDATVSIKNLRNAGYWIA